MMITRPTRAAIAVLAAASLLAVFALAVQSPKPSRGVIRHLHLAPAVTVPVAVHYGLWGDLFPVPTIDVRVGDGPAVPVVLDTGSTGLHIFAQGVRGGVSVTGHGDRIQYADGSIQTGVLARARLRIGRLQTTRAVTFGLIHSFTCDVRVPECPARGGASDAIAHHIYGIMGVGLRRDPGGTTNPLLALPSPYSRLWSIGLAGGGGTLTLGRRPPRVQATIRLPGQPGRTHTFDDTRAKVCWAASGVNGSSCEPTLLDSGNSVGMFWFGHGLLSHATAVPGSGLLAPGTYIVAWVPGEPHPFWTVTTDSLFSRGAVTALPYRRTFVWVPVEAFLALNIGYDARHGEILLGGR